jgi:zinc and cadmium transporter
MAALAWGVVLFGTVAASGVLSGAGLALRLRGRWTTTAPILLGFASGTLLGAARLGLVPEATAILSLTWVMRLVLLAILVFFVLEKWVLRRHCYDPTCPVHIVAGYLILIGDSIHNAVDGLMLGATFAADTSLGVTAGIAILAHEVPQEVGDFVPDLHRRTGRMAVVRQVVPLLGGLLVIGLVGTLET